MYIHNKMTNGYLAIEVIIRSSLMLTNPSDAFKGQSRSPNMVQFDMFGMVSR